MTNGTKWVLGVVVIIILAALVWSSGRKPQEMGTKETIAVAALLPLTGSGADQGEWSKDGLELALTELNKDRKSPIQLVIEDTAGDPKKAVSVYSSITTLHKIPAVFTWGSGVGVALSPLVNKDKVIQMGIATAAPAYTSPDDYTFRNFPSATLESAFTSATIVRLVNKGPIAILKINNDYGVGTAQALETAYKNAGGSVVLNEAFDPGSSDFRSLLAKVKEASPALVYLAVYPKEGALLLKQAKDLGLSTKMLASVAVLGSREFFDVVGTAAEGLVVVSSVPDASNPQVVHFKQSFAAAYGDSSEALELYAARSYDAMKLVGTALVTCEDGHASELSTCIKDELFKVQNYGGASGVISFDRNGDILSNFGLLQVRGQSFVPYK